MTETPLTGGDRDLLLQLLDLPTAGPLEDRWRHPSLRLGEAQSAYAEAAAELGFETVRHGPAEPSALERDDVPLAVRRAAEEVPGFLRSQPNLVLRLGPALPRRATVMFNVHLDTVAGWNRSAFDGTLFHGRGAIDAKGPAVALLAGLRAAVAAEPALGRDTGVIIQAVGGEEGGAMGTFGTRPLVEEGYVGRLNVFCEPTGLRYLPRSTASMTACVRVAGGATRSTTCPKRAQRLRTARLPRPAPRPGAAGHRDRRTGLRRRPADRRHAQPGVRRGAAVPEPVLRQRGDRTRRTGEADRRVPRGPGRVHRTLRRPARLRADGRRGAVASRRSNGTRSDLPALGGADPWAERLLGEAAGIDRWPDELSAFTCDAIWMNGVPGAYTAVCGPGDPAGEQRARRRRARRPGRARRVRLPHRPAGHRLLPKLEPTLMSHATVNPAETELRIPYEDLLTFVTDVLVSRRDAGGSRPVGRRSLVLRRPDRAELARGRQPDPAVPAAVRLGAGRPGRRAHDRHRPRRGGARGRPPFPGPVGGQRAMDLAVRRAATHGVGLVSVRDATHFGCAGYHAARAAERRMVGAHRLELRPPAHRAPAGRRRRDARHEPVQRGRARGSPPAVRPRHEHHGGPHRPDPRRRAERRAACRPDGWRTTTGSR